jgi:hypothetical protein
MTTPNPTPCWRAFEPSPPAGLSRNDFRQITPNGFGDGHNSYPHSMAWHKDHLYVGVTRANMCMLKASKIPKRFPFWPVECPDDLYETRHARTDLPARSRLGGLAGGVSFPDDRRHERLFRSRATWAIAAWRSFRANPTQNRPCTFPPTPRRAVPARLILRSLDGEEFIPVSKPGLVELPTNSIRTLTPFKGRLFTAPTGRAGGQPNTSGIAVDLRKPRSDQGRMAPGQCDPGFGDPDNVVVFEMTAFGDHLYAGTGNIRQGYQVWRTRADGNPPYHWELVHQQRRRSGRIQPDGDELSGVQGRALHR